MILLCTFSGFSATQVWQSGRIARRRKDILFYVCGEARHARADVCIVDHSSNILLLAQEDKQHGLPDGTDPEPQLIAEAIAAFYNINKTRIETPRMDVLASKVMLGIVMT